MHWVAEVTANQRSVWRMAREGGVQGGGAEGGTQRGGAEGGTQREGAEGGTQRGGAEPQREGT